MRPKAQTCTIVLGAQNAPRKCILRRSSPVSRDSISGPSNARSASTRKAWSLNFGRAARPVSWRPRHPQFTPRSYLGLRRHNLSTSAGLRPPCRRCRAACAADPPRRRQQPCQGAPCDDELRAVAALFAISASVSLLEPAIPTAPTTSPFTRTGMPPRSAVISAVTNAVRP
jgi:hypothetical protein